MGVANCSLCEVVRYCTGSKLVSIIWNSGVYTVEGVRMYIEVYGDMVRTFRIVCYVTGVRGWGVSVKWGSTVVDPVLYYRIHTCLCKYGKNSQFAINGYSTLKHTLQDKWQVKGLSDLLLKFQVTIAMVFERSLAMSVDSLNIMVTANKLQYSIITLQSKQSTMLQSHCQYQCKGIRPACETCALPAYYHISSIAYQIDSMAMCHAAMIIQPQKTFLYCNSKKASVLQLRVWT